MFYDISDEDHIPFVMDIQVNNIPKVSNETNNVLPKVNWCNVKDSELQKYYNQSDELLTNIELPIEALSCSNLNCKNKNHWHQLSQFYGNINKSLTKASEHLYSKKSESFV